jgi:hypothetical protein
MRLLIAASFLALICALPSQAAAQALRGSVRDAQTRQPIPFAYITLVSAEGSRIAHTTTDIDGGFLLGWKRPGEVALRVERLGYRTTTSEPFRVLRADTLQASLFIPVDAILLRSLIVADDAIRTDITGELAGVNRRKQMGFGHFISGAAILESGASEIAEVLQRVPGVILQSANGSAGMHAFSAFNAAQPGGLLPASQRRTTIGPPGPGPCPMELFLDGKRFRNSAVGVNLVPAQDVAAIEVYRGLAEVPGEFSGDFARCGVIAIWTRR